MGKLRSERGKELLQIPVSLWVGRNSDPGLLAPEQSLSLWFSEGSLRFSTRRAAGRPGGWVIHQAGAPQILYPPARAFCLCLVYWVPRYLTKEFSSWGVAIWEVTGGH